MGLNRIYVHCTIHRFENPFILRYCMILLSRALVSYRQSILSKLSK